MKIGQYGQYRAFIDNILDQSFMIQLVKITSVDYKFRINNSDDEHLTISKKCFPSHEWKVGESGNIIRKTIIEMF